MYVEGIKLYELHILIGIFLKIDKFSFTSFCFTFKYDFDTIYSGLILAMVYFAFPKVGSNAKDG
jgi:hypothetical protein